MKKALITGITGQDGSYLAELLLDKGYEIHGIIRRSSSFNTSRIDHLYKDQHETGVKMFLHYGDLTDSSNLNRLIEKSAPVKFITSARSHTYRSLSRCRSIRLRWMGSEHYGCLMQSAKRVSIAVFTRHPPRSCMERYWKFHRPKLRLFTRDRLMGWPSSMPIGLLRIIARLTAFTPATAFSSTTNPRVEAKPS